MNRAFLITGALILMTFLTQAQVVPRVGTLPVTGTTSTSGISGGKIYASDPTPTIKGVCWGTHPNPEYPADNHTLDGNGMDPFTSQITGLIPYTKYYLRAYASNTVGTGYGNQVVFWSVGIGDPFQGGKVFYFLQPGDVGYDPELQHGLIAPAADLVIQFEWGSPSSVMWSTFDEIGKGEVNTAEILKWHRNYCDPNKDPVLAADACHRMSVSYSGECYNDWFLPSVNELTELYKNKDFVGGFLTQPGNIYWSSSENKRTSARSVSFDEGSILNTNKSFKIRVRCIRDF